MPVHLDRRDIDRGWAWLVLLAVYSTVVIISTSAFMGGVLYVALLEEYGGDRAVSSLIGSLNSGLLCLLGPFASVYITMFSCRASIVTGGLLVSLACLTSAFVTNVNWLIVTYGILGGIGNAFVSTPTVVVLGYYFEMRRNTVISVCTAVIGLGMFLSSPMALAVIETYGLSGAFMILSGFNAHICVCGMICRPSALEKKIHQQSRKLEEHAKDIGRNGIQFKQYLKKLVSRFSIHLLRNPTFTVFMLSSLTWNLMLSIFLIHLPNYMVTQGASTVDITVIMTCFSVGNTAGRLSIAFIVDRKSINNFTIHIGALSIAGIITIAFPFFSSVDILKYTFAAVSGLLTGVPNSLACPILLEILGVEQFASAHGLEYFFSGIGYILGPPVAGLLYSQTNTYESSFYFAGIAVVLGAAFGTASSILFRRSEKQETYEIPTVRVETSTIAVDAANIQPLLDKT